LTSSRLLVLALLALALAATQKLDFRTTNIQAKPLFPGLGFIASSFQPTFNVYLFPFTQIFVANLGQLVPGTKPFGVFPLLLRTYLPNS